MATNCKWLQTWFPRAAFPSLTVTLSSVINATRVSRDVHATFGEPIAGWCILKTTGNKELNMCCILKRLKWYWMGGKIALQSVQWRSKPVPLYLHHLTAIYPCAADSFNGFNCHFSHIENTVVAKKYFQQNCDFLKFCFLPLKLNCSVMPVT